MYVYVCVLACVFFGCFEAACRGTALSPIKFLADFRRQHSREDRPTDRDRWRERPTARTVGGGPSDP